MYAWKYANHWSKVDLQMTIPTKNISSSPNSYQLPIAPHLGQDFMSTSLLPAVILSDFCLLRYCACYHNLAVTALSRICPACCHHIFPVVCGNFFFAIIFNPLRQSMAILARCQCNSNKNVMDISTIFSLYFSFALQDGTHTCYSY